MGLTKSLAKELAPKRIRVNCVAPGYIGETEMTNDISEQHRNLILQEIPLGRFGRADEVANSVLFLANSKYITGHVLEVSGGLWL